MNRQWRGIGSYLMFFAVICMVLMFFESQMQGKAMYTYEQYEQAIDNADITSATITPNQETPTGTVTYTPVSYTHLTGFCLHYLFFS